LFLPLPIFLIALSSFFPSFELKFQEMNKPVYKPMVIWLFYGCFLIFLMVVIGGITRLTRSGLSIVEWDVVMGTIPPLNKQQWMEMFDKYKQFPEYQKLNYHFTLSDFKSIFWWEYIHRLLARLIGIIFIVPFVYFWAKGKISKSLMPKLLIILALGAFQGFLGWYMVKSGLVDDPFVSHYRLAIHLMAAFVTFGFTFWVALDELYRPKMDAIPCKGLVRANWIFFVVLTIQIIYGAFVAGLKAGYVFTTWPKMGDSWMPEAVTAMRPLYVNFLEGLAGIQFIHRNLAYLLIILVGYIWFIARKYPLTKAQKWAVNLLVGSTLAQVVLGIFTLIYAVPIALGVIHQGWAFLLVTFNLFLLHRLRVRKGVDNEIQNKIYA
jgi:heme a synthase